MDYIYVTSAEDAGNLCVRLTFNDGHQSVVDIGDFIRKHPHPQYNKYLDPDLFRTFVIDDGNVVWGDDWDLIFPVERENCHNCHRPAKPKSGPATMCASPELI